MYDGRVELEVQGEQAAIDQFLRDLKEGPSLSRVTELKVKEVTPSQSGGEFLIRH